MILERICENEKYVLKEIVNSVIVATFDVSLHGTKVNWFGYDIIVIRKLQKNNNLQISKTAISDLPLSC